MESHILGEKEIGLIQDTFIQWISGKGDRVRALRECVENIVRDNWTTIRRLKEKIGTDQQPPAEGSYIQRIGLYQWQIKELKEILDRFDLDERTTTEIKQILDRR